MYSKSIKRIDIVRKFHKYFPAEDIHIHFRQGNLALEKNLNTEINPSSLLIYLACIATLGFRIQ